MPFCVAVALTDGDLHLENLTETRLRDPRITALMRKITLGLDPGMTALGYRGTENASVRIRMRQGREFHHRVDAARGHPSNPLSEGDLREKFQRCTAYSGFGGKAEKMFSVLNRIEEVSDVRELFAV